MEDKIKRLASNLSEIMPEPKEPQQVWDNLRVLMNEQKSYFEKISPQNIIKVIFYIWSLKETGNFKLGEKMLNEISFALVFHHEGNYHKEYCGSCGGEGDIDCNECSSGLVTCENCDGSGVEECAECGGNGAVTEDGETFTCPDCGGEGKVECGECSGEGEVECGQCSYGRLNCNECEGNGEVDTDEFEYFEHFIVTWNSFIKNRCEITEEDTDVTMSEYEFDRISDKFITLGHKESHMQFEDWVIENEMYCAYYNDNPRLIYDSYMEIFTPDFSLKYAEV
jgi:hypothetical protein